MNVTIEHYDELNDKFHEMNIELQQLHEINEINKIHKIDENENNEINQSKTDGKLIENTLNKEIDENNKIQKNDERNEKNENYQNDETQINLTSLITNSSSSGDDTNNPMSFTNLTNFSTILLPQQNHEEIDGYIDIDGYVTPYDSSHNIFFQLFFSLFPCLSQPLFSQYKCEKMLRGMFSISFILSLILSVIFILEIVYCGFASFTENPGLGPTALDLMNVGARYTYGIKTNFEIYRLFSSLFLSPNLIVVIIMVVLCWRYLLYFERRWGMLLFVLSYFITGEAGIFLTTWTNPNNISVCCVCPFVGIIAVYWMEIFLKRKMNTFQIKKSIFVSGFIILLLCVIHLSPMLDLVALIGSFIVGIILGLLYFLFENNDFVKKGLLFQTSVYVSLAVILIGYFVVCCLGIFLFSTPSPISH